MKITFHTAAAVTLFQSMAEGMMEVAADNASDGTQPEEAERARLLEGLIALVGVPFSRPTEIELDAKVSEVACSVIDNLRDNGADKDDAEALGAIELSET